MVKRGQRYRVVPAFGGMCEKVTPQVGRVVYVHPRGRYAVLEFDGVFGRPREGFRPDDLPPEKLVAEKRRK